MEIRVRVPADALFITIKKRKKRNRKEIREKEIRKKEINKKRREINK